MSIIVNTHFVGLQVFFSIYFAVQKHHHLSFIIFIIKSIQYTLFHPREKIMYLYSPITLHIDTLLDGSY